MRPFFSPISGRLEVILRAEAHIHMSRSRRWRKNTPTRKEARALLHSTSTSKMEGNPGEKTDYSTWSQGKLIERVTQLEAELKAQNRRSSPFPLISKTEPDGCSV
jgi:hypothetical protein